MADVGFIGYDIYRLLKDNLLNDCDNLGENLTALGADALGAMIPGVTGLGTASRAGAKVTKEAGSYRPNRSLPRDKHGTPFPDSDIPHTQLGTKNGRNGDYTQGREWGYDLNGKLVPKRDIDFTNHGRPQNHPNPHQHDWVPNPTGGTLQHGPAKPLE